MRFLAAILILLVKIYQKLISPFLHAMIPNSGCRFEPSCSEYMIMALRERGIFVGLALGIWRILRCNPWCEGGYDPPPAAKKNC